MQVVLSRSFFLVLLGDFKIINNIAADDNKRVGHFWLISYWYLYLLMEFFVKMETNILILLWCIFYFKMHRFWFLCVF